MVRTRDEVNEEYDESEERNLEEDDMDIPESPRKIAPQRPIAKAAPVQEEKIHQVIVEREVTLSLINEKLNVILNLLQQK